MSVNNTQPSEKALKAIVLKAKEQGIDSIIVGLEDKHGLITTHFENIPMRTASRIIISLFVQMCDFEAGNESVKAPYRAAMKELRDEFISMIKTHNARLEAIGNAGEATATKSK